MKRWSWSLVLVVACSGAPAPGGEASTPAPANETGTNETRPSPNSEHSAQDEASSDEAAPTGAAASVTLPSAASITAPSANELTARLRIAAQDLSDQPDAEVEFRSLGQVTHGGGSAFAHVATLAGPWGNELRYLLVTMPGEGGALDVYAIELGESAMNPGEEYGVDVNAFSNFRSDGAYVFARVLLREHSAEFATDGDCEQRAQEPTVNRSYELICGQDECAAVVTGLAIVEEGFELDCEGQRTALPSQPHPFEASLTYDDGRLTFTRVSGTLPWPEGSVAMDGLTRERRKRGELTLSPDESE